jgi:hypothetical protein
MEIGKLRKEEVLTGTMMFARSTKGRDEIFQSR